MRDAVDVFDNDGLLHPGGFDDTYTNLKVLFFGGVRRNEILLGSGAFLIFRHFLGNELKGWLGQQESYADLR